WLYSGSGSLHVFRDVRPCSHRIAADHSQSAGSSSRPASQGCPARRNALDRLCSCRVVLGDSGDRCRLVSAAATGIAGGLAVHVSGAADPGGAGAFDASRAASAAAIDSRSGRGTAAGASISAVSG
ncbi:MAG: hypothetical protein ACK55Z_08340, partial [bacterium]